MAVQLTADQTKCGQIEKKVRWPFCAWFFFNSIGSYHYCHEIEIDILMQMRKFVTGLHFPLDTGNRPKKTDYLMAAQHSRKTYAKNPEVWYLYEGEDEECVDIDNEVSNRVAHPVYNTQEHFILDQNVDQVIEISAPSVTCVSVYRLRTLAREYWDGFPRKLENREMNLDAQTLFSIKSMPVIPRLSKKLREVFLRPTYQSSKN